MKIIKVLESHDIATSTEEILKVIRKGRFFDKLTDIKTVKELIEISNPEDKIFRVTLMIEEI